MDSYGKTDEGNALLVAEDDGREVLVVGYDSDCTFTTISIAELKRVLRKYGYELTGERGNLLSVEDAVRNYLTSERRK